MLVPPSTNLASTISSRCSGMLVWMPSIDGLRERRPHPRQRLVAGVAVDDDLADHRVVVRRHEVVGVGVRVDAHAGAARRVPHRHPPRRGRELVRILGVDAALDRVAAAGDRALRERQLLAGGDPDLHLDDVDAGHPFGHRVLDLDAGVHLDEEELAVLVQELERAGAAIADLLAGGDAALADLLDHAARDSRRRRFLDDLLVAPLHRAVALAEPDGVLVRVGEDLDLDVARVLEELLHVHRRVAERRAGLGARHLHRRDERRLGVDDAHAAPAAAARRLDDHRVADRPRRLDRLLRIVGQRAFGAGDARHARLDHRLLGRHLVAHDPDRLGRRADEGEAAALDALGEVGVLGQEAVAGMDRLGVGHLGGGDDRRHVEVALRGRRRADADRLVGELHVLRVAVGLRIDDDRLDAELAAGALDAQGDLAAVGDQDLLEHRQPPVPKRRGAPAASVARLIR